MLTKLAIYDQNDWIRQFKSPDTSYRIAKYCFLMNYVKMKSSHVWITISVGLAFPNNRKILSTPVSYEFDINSVELIPHHLLINGAHIFMQ